MITLDWLPFGSKLNGLVYVGLSLVLECLVVGQLCIQYTFFPLYIFRGFCVYVPLPPLRGQHKVLCHPRWLPTSGLTEFAVCWGEAGFEPRTTDLQSGALPDWKFIYIYINCLRRTPAITLQTYVKCQLVYTFFVICPYRYCILQLHLEQIYSAGSQ